MGSNQSFDNPNLPDYGTAQRGNSSVGCLSNGSMGLNQSNNMYPLPQEHMTPRSDFNLVMPYGRMNQEPIYGGYSQSFQEHMTQMPPPCHPPQELVWSKDAFGNMKPTPNQFTPS